VSCTGGGFFGSFDSEAEAELAIEELGKDGETQLSVVPTAQHFVLIVNGSAEFAVLSMSRTKLKVSRDFIAQIHIASKKAVGRGPSYCRQYKLSAVPEVSNKGHNYYNFKIVPAGFPDEKTFLMAEKMYQDITSGFKSVKIDQEFDAPVKEEEFTTKTMSSEEWMSDRYEGKNK
jgi:hypothetical protein